VATTSPRRGLLSPVGADFPSEYRLAVTNHATVLDAEPGCFSGTLANRATVDSTPVAGDFYYATDTKLLYAYNGTAWGTVMIAGAWVALATMSPNGNLNLTTGGGYTPSARVVGDRLELKGTVSVTGTISTSTALWTFPIGMRPGSQVAPGLTYDNASTTPGITQLPVLTNGAVASNTALANGYALYLDNLGFSLT
jgi:hypothetical protein